MEIMVVVIIIAGLAMMVVPAYISSVQKARASEAVKMISYIAAAQKKYRIETGSYAIDPNALDLTFSGTQRQNNKVTLGRGRIQTPYFYYELNSGQIIATPNAPYSGDYELWHNYPSLTPGASTGSGTRCYSYTTKGQKLCASIGQATNNASVYNVE